MPQEEPKKVKRDLSGLSPQERQRALGPQSKRGDASQHQLSVLESNSHALECFAEFWKHEEDLCEDWAVFYHSYSFAALLYEVHAAVGAMLFGFASELGTLPRILAGDFKDTPDAQTLMQKFSEQFANNEQDHHPDYRKVAISAMCSLVALGPEASTPVVFVHAGYSQRDVSFVGVLEKLLTSCSVPRRSVKKLTGEIVALAERHGLDVSQFGGRPCASGKAGHMLQIFVRRRLVDEIVYSARPWGALDEERHPISQWLDGDTNVNYGQARLVVRPELFMDPDAVRLHLASADPDFHKGRRRFQEELTALLRSVFDSPSMRRSAAASICGGTLPPGWTDR